MEKMLDVATRGIIRLRADPERHKRIYRATGKRSRFENMLAGAARGVIRYRRGTTKKPTSVELATRHESER